MNKGWTAATSLLISLAIAAGLARGGIEGSKHDFSNKAWSDGETCGVCHSPKPGEPPKAAPLWNPNADLTRTFGESIASNRLPGNGTLMCLRCHDGTVAREAISGVRRNRFVNNQNPALLSPSHGRSDHPVGVEYPLVAKGFRPITSVISSGTVTVPDGKVECISCHDPHNESGERYMLVTSLARSGLCLTCHKK